MTRYARSGNTQKHKKMPGEATPWSEFSHPNDANSSKQKKRKNSFNFPKKSEQSQTSDSAATKNMNAFNLSGGKKKFQRFSKKQKTCTSVSKDEILSKNFAHNSSPDNGIGKGIQKRNDSESNYFPDSAQSEETVSPGCAVSVKKNKKNKFTKQQNSEQSESVNKNIANSSPNKVFEKKKNRYMEKLEKRREKIGIPLLSSKVERKLYIIKKKLREKGLPPAILKDIIRRERRKEELKLRKTFDLSNPSKLCFNCRKPGHLLADCPEKLASSSQETGICFKCGSIEHTSFKCPNKVQGFPFAKCFICKEQGHISRDCPNNTHGVYPKGGRCNLCGNVNHLKKDCPSLKKKTKEESPITLHTINEASSIDEEIMEEKNKKKEKNAKPKIVKF